LSLADRRPENEGVDGLAEAERDYIDRGRDRETVSQVGLIRERYRTAGTERGFESRPSAESPDGREREPWFSRAVAIRLFALPLQVALAVDAT
jgi:hypothetical protein